MLEKNLKDFDIAQIADSGQCFRFSKLDSRTWRVIAFRKILDIEKLSGDNYLFYCDENEFRDIWYNYFDLQTDYGVIKNFVYNLNDNYLAAAVNYGYGIRILRQDLWEMIVSYIISQRNNIKRITNTINKICSYFSGFFPSPIELSQFTENDFIKLGLGYRTEYLARITKSVINRDLDLEKLKLMETAEAINYLKQFKGIGEKVANCIVLFGLYRTDAFPIDTWIKRIIDKEYYGVFDINKINQYAGIIQQYMFFYQRFLEKQF